MSVDLEKQSAVVHERPGVSMVIVTQSRDSRTLRRPRAAPYTVSLAQGAAVCFGPVCGLGPPASKWPVGNFCSAPFSRCSCKANFWESEALIGVWWVGRNRGFTGVLIQMQRQAERDARTRAAAQRRASVDAARARRAYERAQASDQKERARLYTESRIADVAALNERLADDVAALEGLLGDTLELGDFLDFESLKETVPRPRFDPGQLAVPEPAPLVADFQPPVPGAAQRLLPGAKKRYGEQFELGRRQYETAVHAHQLREASDCGGLSRPVRNTSGRLPKSKSGLPASMRRSKRLRRPSRAASLMRSYSTSRWC